MGRSPPPRYRAERHSLLCTRKESASSAYRRERHSLCCISTIEKRDTLSLVQGRSLPHLHTEKRDTLASVQERSLPHLHREKRDTLSSVQGRSRPHLHREERHSRLCTRKESASSTYRRGTLALLYREGVCHLSSIAKRDTLSSVQRRGVPALYVKERHSFFCIEKESDISNLTNTIKYH